MSTTLAAPLTPTLRHTGPTTGRVEPLGGLNTYIAEPPTAAAPGQQKNVLLFLSDMGGCLLLSNKLLQDYFAECGFIVLGPDYFFGEYMQDLPAETGDDDRATWWNKKLAGAREAFPKWFNAVKETYGTETTKYTAVGYTFGAPFVMDLAAEGSIVAGAFAHPGFLDDSHFEKVARPILLSCAEIDSAFELEERRRAEDILVRRGAKYFFQVFSGVDHGFATSSDDLDIPDVVWAKEECARGMKDWFLRFSA